MATLTEMRTRLAEIKAEMAEATERMSKRARRFYERTSPLSYELDTLAAAILGAEQREAKAAHNWRNDRASANQVNYIRSLMADLGHAWSAPEGLTKGTASQMIEMLKNGDALSMGVQDISPISDPGEVY